MATKNINSLNNSQVMGWADCPIARVAANRITIGTGGPSIGVGGLTLSSSDIMGWNDVTLRRDAADAIALRRTTNPQSFSLYNTYTSSSVYERGFMRWASNTLEIGTEHLGATQRNIAFKLGTTAALSMSATNPIFIGDATLGITLAFNARISALTDGNMRLSNYAASSFGLLQLGGVSASFPALKRSSATMQARLADDSAFTAIQGKLTADTNATAETPTATHTITIYDATGTGYKVLCLAA